jgi:hypothetical protein
LLHDVGKVETTVERDGRLTAHGHAHAGARQAAGMLSRLGMPSERVARIVWVIKQHMFHLSWNLEGPAGLSSRQARVLGDERFPLLLELLRVDSAGSLGNPRGLKAYEFYRRLRQELDDDREPVRTTPR